jgi:hypothetical protein
MRQAFDKKIIDKYSIKVKDGLAGPGSALQIKVTTQKADGVTQRNGPK